MLVMLAMAWGAKAQDTGYISGTVTDKSGAAVVGAQVVLTTSGGGLTRNTTSNTDGAYVISGLPGGTYDIVVTAKGFQKYAAQKVVLDVAAKIRVDVQLTVGGVNEEVVVTGENVAQVETQSSEISDTITGKQVNQLVLNGRNFTQLVTLSTNKGTTKESWASRPTYRSASTAGASNTTTGNWTAATTWITAAIRR
jgi:hypothetical protein